MDMELLLFDLRRQKSHLLNEAFLSLQLCKGYNNMKTIFYDNPLYFHFLKKKINGKVR